MNSNPSQAAIAATVETTLADRVAALELFAQQLVLVLECEPVFSADALARWMELSRARMIETGTAPLGHVLAHGRLQRQVQE